MRSENLSDFGSCNSILSYFNVRDSQDVDLDAILGELCALEQRCEGEIASTPVSENQGQVGRPLNGRINSGETTEISKNDGMRTDSPDNDSAFSDTVSMLSSESSASSSGSGHKPPQTTIHSTNQQQTHQHMDAASRAKAEKIRLALEKMREASVQKLFIKVFTLDGSGKSLLVDENMSVAHVCRLLADKNHVPMDPKWAVVEHLPDLFMERIYEDHELLVENLLLWTRDSKNKLLFVERPDKTQLFLTPEKFLLSPSDRGNGEYDDHSRNILLEEFFSSSNAGVPEVEGPLYLKSDSKKGWKRYHFILRASGLYYWPKEKARSARDLVCLATFDVNQVYYGCGWRKKYKAPTDFCFAIKHPRLQQAKSTKYIKFLCAEDFQSLERWTAGIRMAKYGSKIMDNYRILMDELAQEDLDLLANARSCSVSSIAHPVNNHVNGNGIQRTNHTQYNNMHNEAEQMTTRLNEVNARHSAIDSSTGKHYTPEQRQSFGSDGRLSRASSSSSSGCLSDGAPSSCEVAFECGEFPTGTIKRKPSMNPKLPLTSITRQLKEVGETVRDEPDCVSPTSSGSSTLTRRHSRRRSGTDSEGSGTLKRTHHRSGNATPVSPGTPVRERASPLNSNRIVDGSQELKSPTSSIAPCMMDSITSLPPPPPSPTRLTEEPESDSESLPPPPPEMFRSNLSLDSLPPPPAPGELVNCMNSDINGSSLSLVSLPPPPSPLVGETDTIRRAKPKVNQPQPLTNGNSSPESHHNNNHQINGVVLRNPAIVPQPLIINNHVHSNQNSNANSPTYAPQPPPFVPPPAYAVIQQNGNIKTEIHQPKTLPTDLVRRSALKQSSGLYATPLYLAELSKTMPSPQSQRRVTIQEPNGAVVCPSSPRLRPVTTGAKKISFNLPPQADVTDCPALPLRKPIPQPPRRSDSTRLSSPKKLAVSDQAPPGDFLKDLQRVMRKKWQVAQKCKQDHSTTPHEVLGFRDPPTAVADYKETNVSNWVQEHYGTTNIDNFYENLFNGEANPLAIQAEYSSLGSLQKQQQQQQQQQLDNGRALTNGGSPIYAGTNNNLTPKRRPPPPPPKRAETTQLTTTSTTRATMH